MAVNRTVHVRAHDDGRNVWEMARIAPPPALDGLIDGYADYWERTADFNTRRELPHAGAVLIVNLAGPIEITGGDGTVLRLGPGEAFAAGAHLRPALSHSEGMQAGVHVFLPLATLRRLLGVPMDQLVDRAVRLDAVLGAEGRDLGERLCEAPDRTIRTRLLDDALTRRLKSVDPLDPRLLHGLTSLRSRPECDIAEIARQLGWSRKHFAARVQDTVGVGPRCLRRLLRFQSLTAAIARSQGSPKWTTLALDAGYYDQAHMIREFREFSGLTPRDFVARSLPDGGGLVEA